MIGKLRNIYPSLVIHENNSNQFDRQYKWYMTDEGEIIGIHKDEILSNDASLLATFLTPYDTAFPLLTAEEQKWHELIHLPEQTTDFKVDHLYRFVYFSMQENQIDASSFKDAIEELFSKQVPILWMNGHEGVIIEEQTILEDNFSYEQIIDILMSDLYVKINFFVGPFQGSIDHINHKYHSFIKSAQEILSHAKKPVVTYVDAIPYLLIDQSDRDILIEITETILQEYISDDDTLKMIETFVQCNLNISETSKELYMHRNTLQYRLDRFLEKTGIDVRQFHHAMAVYIALLAKKSSALSE